MLNDRIDMRIEGEVKQTFLEKCGDIPYYIVLRNLIIAHNEGRITIKPKKETRKNVART